MMGTNLFVIVVSTEKVMESLLNAIHRIIRLGCMSHQYFS